MPLTRRFVSFAALTIVAAFPATTHADWPMFRREPGRNATASHASDLQTPAIAWRQYLGGALTPPQQIAADVNGDGSVEALFVSGGRLLAKRADDTIIWQTAPLDLDRIDAVRDIDGDGTLDVVAKGFPGRVMIFSGRDGHLEWRTAAGTIGAVVGAVRFADLDHDGHDDLYVADAGCGATDSLGDVAVAFTFARGFGTGVEDPSQHVWSMRSGRLEQGRDYFCGINDVIADLNNDGRPEIVTFGSRYMYLFDGATGAKITSAGSADMFGGFTFGFSLPYGRVETDVVDVDHDGSLDIVGYTNNQYDPTINSRAVFVMSYDPSRPAGSQLWVRWSRRVADPALDNHPYNPRGAADFDGNGTAEIATTMVESGVTTTYVLDGGTGAELARFANSSIVAVATLVPGSRPMLIVRHGMNDEGYSFSSFGSDAGTRTPSFTIPFGNVPHYYDRTFSARESATSSPATITIHGTTRRGLVLSRTGAIELWDPMATPTPTAPTATLDLGADLSMLSIAPQSNILYPGEGLLFARSDGYLLVLDDQLRTINFGGIGEMPLPGIRIGGFYSGGSSITAHLAPVAARFAGTTHDEILAPTSRGRLTRYDASHASLLAPPVTSWEWADARNPLAVDTNGDGITDEVAATVGTSLVLRAADGTTELFRRQINDPAHRSVTLVRPIALSRNGSSIEFGVVQFDSGDGTSSIVRVDHAGLERWRSPGVNHVGSLGQILVDDLDGDGIDENIVDIGGAFRVFAGTTGALAYSGGNGHPLVPMRVRGLPGAGTVTHLGGGSVAAFSGYTMSATAATRAWMLATGFNHTWLAPAVSQCGTTRLVATASDYATNDVLVLNVATGGDPSGSGAEPIRLYLAGGRSFVDQASLLASGLIGGQLGSAVATPTLFAGQPAVLVPSSDGYLYAIDACGATPQLLWSLNLRAPVSEPMFADVDGDSQDEIVVEAADGFLYGIDTAHLPSTEWVHDVETGGTSSDDVDDSYGTAIEAEWAPVAGATAYEWAVFTYNDAPVYPHDADGGTSTTAYTQVPATGTLRAHFENVQDGRWYYFSVRAIGPDGNSGEVQSDGTTFHSRAGVIDAGVTDSGAPDVTSADATADAMDASTHDAGPPAHAGCGCRTARGSSRGSFAIVAALLAIAVARSRRRRQHAN